jgi:stage IV sporulation protein B
LPNKEKYKVANPTEIKTGEAKILTVLKDKEVKEYTINIIKLDKLNKNNKNILFEVTDQELLKETGGIVQGMSGSPIIQKDYIIGAVTHVVVDDPTKGYGIFITNMLEEGERD